MTMQAMNSIKYYYANMSFKIVDLSKYQQFEPSQAALADMEIELNASVINEHVPDIESLNRTMKERVRCMYR